jgi:hypothetical protein
MPHEPDFIEYSPAAVHRPTPSKSLALKSFASCEVRRFFFDDYPALNPAAALGGVLQSRV